MSTPSRLRVFVWLEQVGQDVRYALRQFAHSRSIAFVAVATLALGIGATTAIFSVVDGVLLHPVPGRDADRLVQIGEWIQLPNRPTPDLAGLSPATGEALAVTARDFFAGVAWADSAQLDRRGDEFSTLVFGAAVSENFFTLFGAKPALGRGFASGEGVPANHGTPEKPTVIVLSDSWWRTDFGADPRVLGQQIELSGQRHTIVGVMPAYFQFPNAGVKFWLPAASPRLQPRSIGAPNLKLFAQLKPGVDLARTQAMLDTLSQRLMQDHPAGDRQYGDWWRRTPMGLRLWCRSLVDVMQTPIYAPRFEDLRRTLFGFLAAIGFVLAIVCANVASLTLARTERREHELAVRAAVGASRWRLMRQLLTENVLLAVAGGLAGLGVTHWVIQALAAFSTMPRLRPIEIDARMFGVALGVALVTGLISGLAPAWHAGRARVQRGLQHGGFAATSGRRGGFLRGALVVTEVALALVLLTGAGLMVASVVRLLHVDPGYDPVNLAVVAPDFTGRGSLKKEQVNAFIDQLRARLAALPGVVAVGVFKDNYREERFTVEGRTAPVLIYGANAGIDEADYFRAHAWPW
jgi:predicted permease